MNAEFLSEKTGVPKDDSLNATDLVPPPNASQYASLRQDVIPSKGVTTQDVLINRDDITIQDQVTPETVGIQPESTNIDDNFKGNITNFTYLNCVPYSILFPKLQGRAHQTTLAGFLRFRRKGLGFVSRQG